MIAPIFDRCMLCGRPTRKPGEPLCIFHDFQALIELGAERMRGRLRGGPVPTHTGDKISPRSAGNAEFDQDRAHTPQSVATEKV